MSARANFIGLGDEALWLCPTLDDSPNDLSENANHGTYRNGLVTEPETQFGGERAYRFTLNGQEYLEVPHHPAIDFDETVSFTMGGWFRMERTSGSRGYIGKQHPTSPFRGYHAWYSSNTRLELNDVSTRAFNFTGTGRAPNVWTCIYLVVDRVTEQAHLYYDGVNVRSTSITSSYRTISNEAPFYVGTKRASTFWFEGWIDDVRVFRRHLSDEELALLASERGFLGEGTGTPVQVVAGLGASPTLGLIPSVLVGDDVEIVAGLGKTLSRGQLPSVIAQQNRQVQTNSGETETRGLVGSVTTSRNVSTTTQPGRTSTRSLVPSVTAQRRVFVEAESGRTASIGQVPTVSTSSDVEIVADVGSTKSLGLVPTPFVGDDVQIVAGLGETSTRGQVPTITLGRSLQVETITGSTSTRGQVPTTIPSPVEPRRRRAEFLSHPF